MKGKCGRWDGDGNIAVPVWDGQAWVWKDQTLREGVDSPPKSRVRIAGDNYLVVAFWYNDDGTNPDVRKPTNPHVTRRLTIPRYTRVGRERPLPEVQADIDYWLLAQPADIEACIAKLTRKPSDSSRFAAVEALRPKAED